VSISATLGAAATVLVILGYLPQIGHLIRERCSAGISVPAFAMWLAASALFLIHAALIDDVVFLVAQAVNLTAGGIIVALCQTYQGHVCAFHASRGRGRPRRRR
jgi:uncharacterized protein with PQ loop repeat